MPEPRGELPRLAMPKVKIGFGKPSVSTNARRREAAASASIPLVGKEKAGMLSETGGQRVEQSLSQAPDKGKPISRKLTPPPTTEERNAARRTTTVRTELNTMQDTQQSFTLVTTDGKTYKLNLPEIFTAEDIRQALRAQEANALADQIEQYIPTHQRGENAAAHRGLPKTEEEKKEETAQAMFVSTDGRRYNLTLPKKDTAEDIRQALRVQGAHDLADQVASFVPTRRKGKLQPLIKDVWRAVKQRLPRKERAAPSRTSSKEIPIAPVMKPTSQDKSRVYHSLCKWST